MYVKKYEPTLKSHPAWHKCKETLGLTFWSIFARLFYSFFYVCQTLHYPLKQETDFDSCLGTVNIEMVSGWNIRKATSFTYKK